MNTVHHTLIKNKCPFCNSYSVCFYYKNGGFLTVDYGREETAI
jgi:hypothetical protein